MGGGNPHSEGSYPFTTEALRVAFADYAEPEVRAMVESTAASFYGFDLDRCARSATASARKWRKSPGR